MAQNCNLVRYRSAKIHVISEVIVEDVQNAPKIFFRFGPQGLKVFPPPPGIQVHMLQVLSCSVIIRLFPGKNRHFILFIGSKVLVNFMEF